MSSVECWKGERALYFVEKLALIWWFCTQGLFGLASREVRPTVSRLRAALAEPQAEANVEVWWVPTDAQVEGSSPPGSQGRPQGRWQWLPTGLFSVISGERLWRDMSLIASLLLMSTEVGRHH